MKFEFNNNEIALLTAMVLTVGEDIKKGVLDKGDDEFEQVVKDTYSSLKMKILMASFEIMFEEMWEDVKDLNIDKED